MTEVLCYNKGCGKTYNPDNNDEDCVHHPGVPVFHDALKGWSCCKRRTTDFSDFLNIPGCTKGLHSNVKPEKPVAPKVTSSRKAENEKISVEIQPKVVPKPVAKPAVRPSIDEPVIPLPLKVTPSLQKSLQKMAMEVKNDTKVNENKLTWTCRHLSCNATYSEGISETCIHHSGAPVFHEGMKYWTCCQRKTSDFSAFLAQEGCTRGAHDWKVKPLISTSPCRYDWHQTGSVVVISIFAKMSVQENSSVKVNQVTAEIELSFEGGTRNFELDLELSGVIDPSKSFVTLFGTKVEITLKKADASHWKMLNIPRAPKEDDSELNEDEPPVPKQVTPVKSSENQQNDDDSDLSGIDDTEFD